jgi:predicted nucleic-acid-binding Zn-ribbon protein
MSFFTNLFKSNNTKAKKETIKDVPVSGTCPYCNKEISPFPKSKKKCPHCSESIAVRTHFKTKEKVLLTEEQVKLFDIEKEKYYTVTIFLRGLSNNIDIEKKTVDKLVLEHTNILRKKFGTEPSFADVAWGVSNKLITKYPDASRGIRFQQALFLHREGKDPTKIRQVDFANDLKGYKETFVVKQVEVITAGEDSCEHCRKLEGKKFTIQEALEQNILPCKECTNDANKKGVGWCRCCYAPVV